MPIHVQLTSAGGRCVVQVLLVFARVDAQCVALERAADAGHYEFDVARSPDAALQSFVARQHDVVVVDTRHGSDIDAESFARSQLNPVHFFS